MLETWFAAPEGFNNPNHAAQRYSWIRPPSTSLRSTGIRVVPRTSADRRAACSQPSRPAIGIRIVGATLKRGSVPGRARHQALAHRASERIWVRLTLLRLVLADRTFASHEGRDPTLRTSTQVFIISLR